MKARRRLRVFFDGGARPNPGRIEIAVVARGRTCFVDDKGKGTNGDAEWLALIEAYAIAASATEGPFELVGDSAHVIDCATGAARCRGDAARDYLRRFEALSSDRPAARIRRIGRAQNLAGIALELRRR